ncbi:MAG: 3-phosphoglycerate dehydrogenase, partial [Oscillospiraceae bacterium]|nr:3-phosphoglycerate dehydrogenase [Oscillospiraceae bacterium]
MFEIKTMNSISPMGLEVLTKKGCRVGPDIEKPQALLIRSADLHGYPFNEELLCIARAGAGTNNIPVEDCAEQGIVVFNSPGANAEAVKELEMCSLVLASRDVLGSIAWVRSIAGEGEEIPRLVEKGKNAFGGPELMGKTMGVIGLGATGALVANLAVSLEMTVYGHDPFMSVDAAWNLSRDVLRAESLDELLEKSDYI